MWALCFSWKCPIDLDGVHRDEKSFKWLTHKFEPMKIKVAYLTSIPQIIFLVLAYKVCLPLLLVEISVSKKGRQAVCWPFSLKFSPFISCSKRVICDQNIILIGSFIQMMALYMRPNKQNVNDPSKVIMCFSTNMRVWRLFWCWQQYICLLRSTNDDFGLDSEAITLSGISMCRQRERKME